jgi:acyl-coenzyme A thioesterase PaaI-like protein
MMTQPQADTSPVDDDACFACGTRNGHGLRLRFVPDGPGAARAAVSLDPHLQGYRGIAHGGIVMLLLDEVMAHACGSAGDKVMTAAVAVRFRAPVPLGVPLELRGRVLARRGKIIKVEASLGDAAGATLATAEGSFARLGPVDARRFGNAFAPEAV